MTKRKRRTIPEPRILMQGGESSRQFEILLGLTSIRSEDMIHALRQHYVEGFEEEIASMVVDLPNFKRAAKKLDAVARAIDAYHGSK